jgi:hypothetical protein
MSGTVEGRDPRSGRFLTGNSGGGRQRGSRNKLSEQFIADVYAQWQESGSDCLCEHSARRD